MFWYFPLRWGWSLVYYLFASIFCFGGLSVAFEDYEWARKLIDPLQPRRSRIQE